MTTQALGSAISGLRVAQKALDVTATNISNASVEGYTRKTLPQEVIVADGVGMGVRYGEIQRHVDQSLMRDYRTQLGVENYYSTRQTFLNRIVSVHGATDQQSNIGARLGQLYDQFVKLSATPDSRTQQSAVVDAANRVAQSLNTFADTTLQIRNEVQQNLKSEVATMNNTLKQIADLNRRIQSTANVGRSTATMEDQRDVLVKKISEQLDVSYFIDGGGTLVLQTKRGVVLADTEAREIQTDQQTLTYGMGYPGTISGLIVKGSGLDLDIDLASTNPGGKLGALLQVRDEDMPSYMAQIDELAYKMMARFNDQGVMLFTDSAGVVPPNDPSVYSGIAASIQINPFILDNPGLLQSGTSGGPINAGSNDIVMNVINYTFGRYRDAAGTPNEPFVSTAQGYNRDITFNIIGDPNVTLEEFARSMIDRQAEDLNMTKSTLEQEQQYTAEVEKRLLDSSAVNTDEEMTQMIVLQKSYGASAKMISALDQLFRDLLNAI